MFHSARLALTAWYLIIIMCISFAFSAVIYTFLSREVERFSRVQRIRIEHQRTPFGIMPIPDTTISYDPDLVAETKYRILYTLVLINGFIVIVSGGLGYVLAGRTLRPIQDMVNEQHRFIQDASHELRTPLTSLKSSFEVSLRDKHAKMSELTQTIKDGIIDVNKLQALTDALLQLAQYEKHDQRIRKEIVHIHTVLQTAVESVQSIAKQKKIAIHYPQNDFTLQGSTSSLIEVFVILLENAIKYSPLKSDITIETHVTDKSIKVSVTDQGIGIEKKDMPYIFDRFYRADEARTNNETSGYGLGLSIAKHLVSIHNGTISVSSEKNSGTIFTVTIPV